MVSVVHKRGRGRRTWIRISLLLAAVLLVIAEGAARTVLGLGDPPLFMRDPKIEYMNVPGTYHRFGRTIHVNKWSQRSGEIEPTKADPNEYRVLVVGDSVVNGGAWLDDAQVATTLLEQKLAKELGRPTRVLNISAGSWGPPNQLAYLEKFGFFDADAMIVVWSSHDAWDIPSFGPFGVDQPDRRPLFALQELVSRYVLPRFVGTASPKPPTVPEADLAAGVSAAAKLLELAHAKGIPTAVMLHETRKEIDGKPEDGEPLARGKAMLRDVAVKAGAQVTEDRDVLASALARGQDVMRDDIHPSAGGQSLIADLYLGAVRGLLTPQGTK